MHASGEREVVASTPIRAKEKRQAADLLHNVRRRGMGDSAQARAVQEQIGHSDRSAVEDSRLDEHPAQCRLSRAVTADEFDDHRISR
jgi:hypothetical protein